MARKPKLSARPGWRFLAGVKDFDHEHEEVAPALE
jgi:hypothetical protein